MSDDERPTNFSPMRIAQEKLQAPRKDQPLVELRFVNPDGETEVWLLGKGALPWDDKDFRGAVRMAYLDRGVDMRLANQRDAIERLQKDVDTGEEALTLSQNALADARKHIAHHHAGLIGVFGCGYPAKEAAK